MPNCMCWGWSATKLKKAYRTQWGRIKGDSVDKQTGLRLFAFFFFLSFIFICVFSCIYESTKHDVAKSSEFNWALFWSTASLWHKKKSRGRVLLLLARYIWASSEQKDQVRSRGSTADRAKRGIVDGQDMVDEPWKRWRRRRGNKKKKPRKK